MARWHVMIGSDRPEEMSPEEVERAYRERRIGDHTLVWQKGMAKWLPLEQVLWFRRDSSIPPPPPPAAAGAAEAPEPAANASARPPAPPQGSFSPGAPPFAPFPPGVAPFAGDAWARLDPRRFVRAGQGQALAWTSYAWITWYIAGLLGATAGIGFFGYAVWLYVLSAIACCFCPCIGLAGASATTALWGLLWLVSIAVATSAWCLAMGLSSVAMLKLLGDDLSPRPVVVGNFLMHLAVGAVLALTGSFATTAALFGLDR
jgi:hypothetical protein